MPYLLDDGEEDEEELEQPPAKVKVSGVVIAMADFLFPKPTESSVDRELGNLKDGLSIDAGGEGVSKRQRITEELMGEIADNADDRDRIRKQLTQRWQRIRLWIVVLTVLLFPLIIVGTIFLALTFPVIIKFLAAPFIFGTPAGWAMLGIVTFAALLWTLEAVIYSGVKLAEKFNWGGKINIKSSRQAFLAMMTPFEEPQRHIEMPPKKALKAGLDMPALEAYLSDSLKDLERAVTEQPLPAIDLQKDLEQEKEKPVAETPIQSFITCVERQLQEALSHVAPYSVGVLKKLQLLVVDVNMPEKSKAEELSFYIASLQKVNVFINWAFFPPMRDSLLRSFDPVVVELLQVAKAENLLAPENIVSFVRLATKERLLALSEERLQALSEQFSNYKSNHAYEKVDQKGKTGEEAQKTQIEINKLEPLLAEVLKEVGERTHPTPS